MEHIFIVTRICNTIGTCFSVLNVIFGHCPLLDTNMVVNFHIFYGNLFYRTKLTNHHLLIIGFIMLRKDEI